MKYTFFRKSLENFWENLGKFYHTLKYSEKWGKYEIGGNASLPLGR